MEINESKYLHIRPPKEALWAMIAFLAVLSVFFLVKIRSEFSGYNRAMQPPSISVSGEGKILIKPDIAIVNVGVLKEGTDLLAVQRSAAEVMNRLSDTLKKKGVLDKDTKTTSYSISPRYDYKDGEQKFRGYEIFQNLEVKIRELSKVGEILSGAAQAGANQIGSLSFSVDDPKKAKEEARALAITDAKTKAATLSKNLNVGLGKILGYSESEGGIPMPIFAKAESFGMGGPGIPPTPEGENEIHVNVNLTYEIR
ncbi:hypothetical protein A3G55_02005 [Candidatus Giovannonibacteria bacterium RIFCSPLOWO2_12_FULL_44_25]|uniref:26 kDa periplasmic immunogenic protein n=1 Tax=Candidatus Giovannonibacteria bacterium RIFCSPHIGHO2_02_FULL_45_40 TaxID=1798337 RepID=A0A1F5W6S4_9BACT|nr:MAG: hypothetical protein UW15_C0024G0032 [Parcubacteria group bacterium GW2011_GWC1_44_10]OGF49422.1 MAG: hypothetical protein A2120_03840 [Candidatus Giovannonibacteria bacterium GWA2_45_15]OGF59881.1 MAG: hypothetical protein A2W40_02130 [Candidatus Giovannonibacteria bacterium RIFCSPHIGHO2_01_45_12]OGF61087.1 MAG: hypothetical protein A2656_02455 [Candidatus Giovannonibacteria bacterium RIFCSPHIGHO2_01_FULL_44_100]OGF71287.1 MAG: hypothetical protein A3C05_04340 [Candidatus Giovannonibac